MTRQEIERYRKSIEAFLYRVTRGMGDKRRHKWAQSYLLGLLLDGERKSIEPLAARMKAIEGGSEDYEQALQQFINQSSWSAAEVLVELRSVLREVLGCEGTFIVDDTSFPKQGEHSVGVARQYCGSLGKIANCQVGVTLHWNIREQTACLDCRLYMPQEWVKDNKRCRAAGVPQEVVFRPKWELAQEMILKAQAEGFSGQVIADAGYGNCSEFRGALDQAGIEYCMGIESTPHIVAENACLGSRRPNRIGRPSDKPEKLRKQTLKSKSVRGWAQQHHDDFRTVTWRKGTKGQLSSRFAAWRVCPYVKGRNLLPPLWLLVEWPTDSPHPTKYFFSNLAANSSLKTLVSLAKRRFSIEQSYREMKDELGLDHFEGRSWTGWHHHVALVMLALAFLVLLRGKQKKKILALST